MKFFTPLSLMTCSLLFLSPVPIHAEALLDLSRTPFPGSQTTAQGPSFTFDLGTRRVNWNHARWSMVTFDRARDLSAFSALRVSALSPTPRRDAVVVIALRESGGAWYYHPAAVPLTQSENQGLARFSDFALPLYMAPPGGGFVDPNNRFDPESISAVAVGVVNPLGVGEVRFILSGLELLTLPPEHPAAPLRIEVTGRLLDINGTQSIPAGLFGGYNLTPDSYERYRFALKRENHGKNALESSPVFGNPITHISLNNIGERVIASGRLTDADWRERSQALARHYAESAREAGQPLYVEFWNEPYLNWANKNRINFNPEHYNLSEASEGGVVRIGHDGEEVPHLRWTRDYDVPPWNWDTRRNWRRGRDAEGKVWSVYAQPYFYRGPERRENYYPETHPPEDVADGESYRVTVDGQALTLTAFTPWHIYDETQFTFWSGKGMRKLYVQQLLAFGEILKREMPEAVLVAGWDFRPGEDHWAAWDLVYKDTIDRAIHLIDGVTDHDYGGSPTRMAANYEAVTSYGMITHDKWLVHYNTETAMGGDPQAYPQAEGVASGAGIDNEKVRWTAEKMLHALRFVPDKAKGFCWFGHGGGWFTHSGEGIAFELLKNLRGRLLQTVYEDDEIHVVAAIDGSDPQNPRPASLPAGQELVVALYHAGQQDRDIDLNLSLPEGLRAGAAFTRETLFSEQGPSIQERHNEVIAEGETLRLQRSLASRSLLVVTVPLIGERSPETAAQVFQEQFFVPVFLEEIGDTPVETVLDLPEASLENLSHAWLRLVVEHLGEDAGRVRLNGTDIPLPRAVTPANTPRIVQIPIDPALLRRGENHIQFRLSSPSHADFLLCSAALNLERSTRDGHGPL